MKKFFFGSRKRLALTVSLVVALAAAAGAYAYFTATGSGSGTFTTDSPKNIVITSVPVGPLWPQSNPANTTPITVDLNNPGDGPEYVGTLSGTVAPPTVSCNAGWFTVAPVTVNAEIAPGDNYVTSSVILNDLNTNQNACAGKTVGITWSSTSG